MALSHLSRSLNIRHKHSALTTEKESLVEGNMTVLDRFSKITPQQFEQEVDRLWNAADTIKNSVVKLVASQDIPVTTGLGIISCITGQIFGYQLFHGEPTSADLLLQNGYEQANRREPVGAR